MFHSLITELIAREVQCGECLRETVSERQDGKFEVRDDVTWFPCRALARCSVPCGPISVEERFSVVSVCME